MSQPTMGALIRPLTEGERQIRNKYQARVQERELQVQRALAAVQEAKAMLNDIALAFNGGQPCVMTQDALHAPADG